MSAAPQVHTSQELRYPEPQQHRGKMQKYRTAALWPRKLLEASSPLVPPWFVPAPFCFKDKLIFVNILRFQPMYALCIKGVWKKWAWGSLELPLHKWFRKKNHIHRKLLLAYVCCLVNRVAFQKCYQSFVSEMLLGMMLKGWNSTISSTSSYIQDSENICIPDDLVSALFLKWNYKIPWTSSWWSAIPGSLANYFRWHKIYYIEVTHLNLQQVQKTEEKKN